MLLSENFKKPIDKRAIRLIAVYAVCCGWYSGQWSRGYRLLCRCKQYLSKHYGIEHPTDSYYGESIQEHIRNKRRIKRLIDKYTTEYKDKL